MLIIEENLFKIYCEDNISYMKTLEDGCIDLTVTSPPYDYLRDYTNESEWSFDKFKEVAQQLYRITKDGGVIVWNVADQTVDGDESGTSFKQALYFKEIGLRLADTMIYKKQNPGGARGSNKTYIQSFEYMFVFSKGKLLTHNLLNDRPNKVKDVTRSAGGRKKDGSMHEHRDIERKSLGRRFNIWEYSTVGNEYSKQHPAPFPYKLAEDHILSWSNEGDTVFDPFNGSGTTMVGALSNNRKSIGVDISVEYCELAKARLQYISKEVENLSFFGFKL